MTKPQKRKKRDMHKKARGKHEHLCDIVFRELKNKGHFVKKDIEYGTKTDLLGQLDVYQKDDKKCVYWEIKGNYHLQNYEKAQDQLLRYTDYMHRKDKNRNYYGVFYTPEHIYLLSKNSNKRNLRIK